MFCEGNGDPPPDPTSPPPDPTNTPSGPTNTPPPTGGQCLSIQIYKDGNVTEPSSLVSGDQVQIAVSGNGDITKARIKINGGAWIETSSLNGSNEYIVEYTVPEDITSFQINGEIFVNGSWI